jgi:hypothetical protein
MTDDTLTANALHDRLAAAETEIKTLEMTLDGVKALYEQRIAALEAAARAVVVIAPFDEHHVALAALAALLDP